MLWAILAFYQNCVCGYYPGNSPGHLTISQNSHWQDDVDVDAAVISRVIGSPYPRGSKMFDGAAKILDGPTSR